MCMSLILDFWETAGALAGCNLYSPNFRLCVLTVQSNQYSSRGSSSSRRSTISIELPQKDPAMYFRERDKGVVDAETFLALAVPKILISCLIIFLNIVAIISMIKSKKWISNGHQGFYILPQSTQGLLNSIFVTYLILGLLTLYSQISLSTFVLGDFRFFEDQGSECLGVNSLILAISMSISFHLLSLAIDRMLASYLPYSKYCSLSNGTLPLWLSSIWMPSIILGALPLAGWKTNFSFCIFFHQFKDEYLRFVSGFFLTNVLLMPCLYFFFLLVLKPKKDDGILLYRYHRKLQQHHRLTFILVLVVNIISWTPFHIYLLMSCLTCPYAYLGSGFTLEYLYMVALVPSLIIPLMFSIKSNVVDKCANKLSKCVRFDGKESRTSIEERFGGTLKIKPGLSQLTKKKSPLFFIDDLITQSQKSQSTASTTTTVRKQDVDSNNECCEGVDCCGTTSSATSSGGQFSNGSVNDRRQSVKASNFFVPKYLPPPPLQVKQNAMLNARNTYEEFNRRESKYIKKSQKKDKNAPLRNFCAYLNTGYCPHSTDTMSVSITNKSSDSKYGFPIKYSQRNGIYAKRTAM